MLYDSPHLVRMDIGRQQIRDGSYDGDYEDDDRHRISSDRRESEVADRTRKSLFYKCIKYFNHKHHSKQ